MCLYMYSACTVTQLGGSTILATRNSQFMPCVCCSCLDAQQFVTQQRVTLNNASLQIRDWIAPVNRRWPLSDLLDTLHELYPRALPGGPRPHRGKRRHVLFEYVMLRGVNDSVALAHEV